MIQYMEPIHGWIVLLFSLFFIFAYIKIKYPFWNIQPVYHTYDYWRMCYSSPFIIYKHRPIKTKFCDFDHIKTFDYLECSREQQEELLNIFQCYYIPSEKIIHDITAENLGAILTCAGHQSFISLYMPSTTPIAAITSRFANMYIRDLNANHTNFPIYFIDYLCVHREHDATKISRKLLQTHEYNQRIKNPSVAVSLIKKEVDLFEGIVPLVTFQTSTFFIRNHPFPALPPHFQVVRITTSNIDLLHDFMHSAVDIPALFDLGVMGDIGSLISMIKTDLLYAFCLQRGEHIYAYYFIKDAKMQVETDGTAATSHTLQSVCSIINTKDERLFYLGFLHSLHKIVQIHKKYKMIIFDEIGHNVTLMQHWRRKNTPIFTNPSAYYLFNMVYPCSPINAEKCLFLL